MDYMQILYSDRALACVDKPSGLLSVPGKGPNKQDCVVSRLVEQFGWAREAHRLDMDTSGLMIVALDADSHRDLCKQFRDRTVIKEYEAVVWGVMEDNAGDIDLPMRPDYHNRPRQIIDHEQGKAARTRYDVIERLEDRTRVRLTPATGRSHQLRVHLAMVGHPILGDDLYATAEALAMSSRLLLHATRLGVNHPASGERLEFASPCPF